MSGLRVTKIENKGENALKKKLWKWLLAGSAFATAVFCACDMRLKTVVYTVESEKVGQQIRIALVTDLHSCKYGEDQKTLIEAIDTEKPDVVLFGGDIYDDKRSYDHAENTMKQLAEKYPCYYVTGNHEYWGNDVDNILEIVKKCGVKILSAECEMLEVSGEKINICGVDDPDVATYTDNGVEIQKQLEIVEEAAEDEYFTILLSHRPELADTYAEYDFDLVLSGHAHGGQWRIPGILNGLYAPHQGIFPKYAGGRYEFENQTLIVSRGLARESTLVPRIFNRPELVIVDIK